MKQRLSIKRFLRVLPWLVGICFSLPLVAYAVFDLLTQPSMAQLPATVFFTSKQLEVAFDTAKALLPICTGYLIAAAPILKYLHQKRQLTRPAVVFGVVAIFGLGVVAVGLWTGVFAFLIAAANAVGQGPNFESLDGAFLNHSYSSALLCARMGHLCFFGSIVWFAATAIEIMFLEPDDNDQTATNVA